MIIINILGFFPEVGGPVRSTGNLIKALQKRGVKCKIISPLPPNYDKSKLSILTTEFDIDYYELDGYYKYFPSYSSKFAEILERNIEGTSIIHLNGIFDYYTYYVCKNIRDIPIIISPRGSLVKWGFKRSILLNIKKNLFLKTIGKTIFNRVNIIHLTSEYEKMEFESVVGNQYNDKVVIIPNGINFNIKENIDGGLFRERFKIGDEKRIVLFVGRLNKEKGLELLIPAFSKVSIGTNNLLMVIAGPDEKNYKNELFRLVDKYHLSDKVLFTGMIDGDIKWSAYKAADVFVLPSYTENFGMAVVEAMMCKTPVVMSDQVGIAYDIKNDDIVVRVKSDIDSLYIGMKSILTNKEKAKNLSKEGFEYIKNYSIESVSDIMLDLYKNILLELEH